MYQHINSVFSHGVKITSDFYSFFVLIYSFQIFHSEPILLLLKIIKQNKFCCCGFDLVWVLVLVLPSASEVKD